MGSGGGDMGQIELATGSVTHTYPQSKTKQLLWTGMLVLEVLIYSSYSILIHLCKVDGKIPFRSSSLVLLIELCKLLVSCAMLYPETKMTNLGFSQISLPFCLPFAVPAVLYTFNNNIAVHMQLEMDPTTYQVLCNMKIATTALLYRLLIKRVLTGVQWFSICLLMVAGVCDSYGGMHSAEIEVSTQIHITSKGLMMISLYCFVSGLAAVYSEYILKKHFMVSLHLQNVLLYVFGIVLNGSTWLLQSWHTAHSDGFFHGFSSYTWLIVITQAANGLIMSVVMKHGSNIIRLFIISSAMVTTTFLSVAILGTRLNLFFLVAFMLVVGALVLYYRK